MNVEECPECGATFVANTIPVGDVVNLLEKIMFALNGIPRQSFIDSNGINSDTYVLAQDVGLRFKQLKESE